MVHRYRGLHLRLLQEEQAGDVDVRRRSLYAECNECSRKRLKRERVDPAAAIARWSTKLKPVRTLTFTGHAFALPPHCASTPLGLFHRFVTVDIIDRMVDATNLYAHRAERKTKVPFLFPFTHYSDSHLVCTWCFLPWPQKMMRNQGACAGVRQSLLFAAAGAVAGCARHGLRGHAATRS